MESDRPVVLIVDDDPIALAVTQERIEDMGFTAHARDQVLGTSQWVVQNRPWLILLDVMMPAMSGGEFAGFLRRRGIDTHIVLHSSKEISELQKLVRSTGALGAIRKGLDDKEFERQFTALTKTLPRGGGISPEGS